MEKDDVLKRVLNNRKRRIEANKFNDHERALYYDSIESKSRAIKAFCNECIGYSGRDAIIDCCGYSCPLYFHRPSRRPFDKDIKQTLLKTEIKPVFQATNDVFTKHQKD